MNCILNFCIGILIGAGAILPGISSGVLCIMFGIYEKLISSVLGIFKDFKKNICFLLPIASGAFVGIISFGNILKYLFNTFPMQTQFAFIGLILGGIPVLFKKANNAKGFRLHYLLYLLFTFFIGILLIILENRLNMPLLKIENINFFYLVLCGFLMSIGIVVPGVSSSVILMLLGVYYIYLDAIASLNLVVFFPIGIGAIIGGILFLNLIKYFLDYHYTKTFYCIIGFVLGSIFIILPKFSFNLEGLISTMIFFICFCLASQLEKISKN